PLAWTFLHCIAFNYPVKPTNEDKQNYAEFLRLLTKVLPCGACRKNLEKNLCLCPFEDKHFRDRYEFSKRMYELHNTVNTMLGKPNVLSFEEVRDRFEMFRSKCDGSKAMLPKESGCVDPMRGVKTKCQIKIVPDDGDDHGPSLIVDKQCMT